MFPTNAVSRGQSGHEGSIYSRGIRRVSLSGNPIKNQMDHTCCFLTELVDLSLLYPLDRVYEFEGEGREGFKGEGKGRELGREGEYIPLIV